ncbi:nucleolar essential protein-like protein [Wolffia australiana]
MPRPYAVKWLKKKRKRNHSSADPDSEDVNEGSNGEESESPEIDEDDANDRAGMASDEALPTQLLPGLPLSTMAEEKRKPGVIFILEKASLNVGKVGKKETILNADDHTNYLRKQGKDPADFRPDILHQAMLAILDSPLNKAGRLQALFVKTDDGELIDVKPHVRLPRTFKRFCGLMYQLKCKKSIHATGKREKLFRMIKNPVTQHLPVNSRKIGFSFSSEKLVHIRDYVTTVGDDTTIVFVVGAMAHGKIEADYVEDCISVSNYPLSAACCLSRICNVLELKWNIL